MEWPTDVRAEVTGMLRAVRGSLGLSVAFLTSLHPDHQRMEILDSDREFVLREGASVELPDTFCRAILAGEMPPVIPDVHADPVASRLPGAAIPGIRGFVSVPVRFRDGSVYGTVCAYAMEEDGGLLERDRHLLEVVAGMAGILVEPAVRDERRRGVLAARYRGLLAAGGPRIVVQPIRRIGGGIAGFEALSRFPAEWGIGPDTAFAEAHDAGLGVELEVAAVRRAIAVADRVEGCLAVNVSAQALGSPELESLVRDPHSSPHRLMLEMSEHSAVDDYDALLRVVGRMRAAGISFAIDDVGAGYSSLQHLVRMAPDVIKLDRSIVTGLAGDRTRTTLVGSLAAFARGCGAHLIAEGVETQGDLVALDELGVPYGQGWHLGRPGTPADDAHAGDGRCELSSDETSAAGPWIAGGV